MAYTSHEDLSLCQSATRTRHLEKYKACSAAYNVSLLHVTEFIGLIRCWLFSLHDLARLQKHTNTHAQCSEETLTLLTGRLSLTAFNQHRGGFYHLINPGREYREGRRNRRAIGESFISFTRPDVLCLRQKPKE